jgi:very-short-patch-repair endonuclease
MTFELEHSRWLERHCRSGKGERLRRLREGHGHAEKLFLEQVWYPAFRHFEHLHPEYEVSDYRDGTRYLDFAYIAHPLYLCIEIDGYGTHARDLDRRQFSDQLLRQNHLTIEGWRILRFAYDDVHDKPRMCQQVIQQFFGRMHGGSDEGTSLTPAEKEIVRFAMRKQAAISLGEAASVLSVGAKSARNSLRSLVRKQILSPVSGERRHHAYRLSSGVNDILF